MPVDMELSDFFSETFGPFIQGTISVQHLFYTHVVEVSKSNISKILNVGKFALYFLLFLTF